MWSPNNLVEVLERHGQTQPERRAFTFLLDGDSDEVALTYAQLTARAQSLGAMLRERGLAGGRAVLLYPPGPEFIVAFFGCLYAGVAAVPVYPPEPERMDKMLPRLRAILADAQAGAVLTSAMLLPFAGLLTSIAPETAALPFIATDTAPNCAASWRLPHLPGDAIAMLQYTSGSTGTPRGVQLTHANLMHNLEVVRRAFGNSPGSTVVSWLPPYHDMGLIGGILQPLYVGCAVALMSPMSFLQRPFLWLRAVSRFGGTASGGPNFAYELCVRKVSAAELTELDLSRWQVAFVGAEPTRVQTLERFAEKFRPCGFKRQSLFPCYGLAESTLYATGGWLGDGAHVKSLRASALVRGRVEESDASAADCRQLVGCGVSAEAAQCLIVDPERAVLTAPGQVGEIWLASPSVAAGYWQREAESAATFAARLADGSGPYLRTGDLGFMDAGELFVTGRIKDILKIRGLSHAPQDIERTVEECHPAIRPGCVAAFSYLSDGEEQLVVAAELQRSHSPSLRSDAAANALKLAEDDAVLSAVRAATAEQHGLRLHALLLLEAGAIPKTSSGKIRRSACREGFVDGTLALRGAWREASQPPAPPPAASAYRDLAGACAAIDRRKTRYRFDLEKDVPWHRIAEPGLYYSDSFLKVLGIDAELLRQHTPSHDLFQWALAIAMCEEFIQLEETLVDFARTESQELGPSRSVNLLCEEEDKHIELFRRMEAALCSQRPKQAARLKELMAKSDRKKLWGFAASDATMNLASYHYHAWLHILFFEELTIHLHQCLKGQAGVQPTWQLAHALHRQEEIQHVVTDFVHLQALRISDAERRLWSGIYLNKLATNLHHFSCRDSVLQLLLEEFPERAEAVRSFAEFSENKWLRERALLQLLREEEFDKTVRSMPAFASFAARPDLNRTKAQAAAEPAGSALLGASAQDLQALLIDFCAHLLGIGADAIQPQRFLSEYGMDSVAVVELAQLLSTRIGSAVTPMFIWSHPTIESLASVLAAGMHGTALAATSPDAQRGAAGA